jgi:hypothetical protein
MKIDSLDQNRLQSIEKIPRNSELAFNWWTALVLKTSCAQKSLLEKVSSFKTLTEMRAGFNRR